MALKRAEYIIGEYACRGAVIFSNSKTPLSGYLNPSAEHHASIYFGQGIVSFLTDYRIMYPLSGLDDGERCVIEFNTSGIRVVGLHAFLSSKKSVKVYYFTDAYTPATDIMRLAPAFAFEDVHKHYGLGKTASYCFKTIAHCYAKLGVEVRPVPMFGRKVVLSQSFTQDERWVRVYDSATGKSLLPWNGYFEWSSNG